MIEKKKILVLTSSFPRWKNDNHTGGGQFIINLSKGFLNTFEIFVLAPYFHGAKVKEKLFGFNIRRFRQNPFKNANLSYSGSGILPALKKNKFLYLLIPFYLIFQFYALKKTVNEEKIKILHAHWIFPQGLVAVVYKKLFNKKIKILATINGSDFWGFNNVFGKTLKKFVLKNVNCVTVPNTDVKVGIEKMGIKAQIHILPMGLDTSFFNKDKKELSLKKELNINGPFLLFVGALVEDKGIKYLFKSMVKIVLVYPKAVLVVIGKGYLEEELKLFAKENNIENNIRFIDEYIPDEDLPKYFATSDVFILPTLSEGFPIAFMEAISSSTYTIVSDIPVFKSLLENHKISTLVRVKNSEDIYEKTIEILENFVKFSPTKAKARDYVVANHDWKIVQKNYLSLLLKLTVDNHA